MKNKIIVIVGIFIISLFPFFKVEANNDEVRSNKNNKTLINVNGRNAYVSVWLNANLQNGKFSESAQIKNVTASYNNGIFYISVKRSDINNAFTKKYDDVYEYLEYYVDFHDIKQGVDYSYIKQYDFNSTNCGYTLVKGKEDYDFANYNFLELTSGTIPLSGLHNSINNGQDQLGGGLTVFEGSLNGNYEPYPKQYCKNDFQGNNKIFEFDKLKSNISVIEDVQMNLGENTKIVSSDNDFSNNKIEEVKTKDIDNFYAEYLENNKLKYSWTMYDTNGNPINLDVNKVIKFDQSENEEKIMELDPDNILSKDNSKIISFEHDGELGGKAKISMYVGDKFKSDSVVNIYYYNPESNKLENINPSKEAESDEVYSVIVDKDGYIAVELTHCSEYLLTNSKIDIEGKKIKKEIKKDIEDTKILLNKNTTILFILFTILLMLTIVVIFTMILKKRRIKNEKLLK